MITDLVDFFRDEMAERVHIDVIAVVSKGLFAFLTCEKSDF